MYGRRTSKGGPEGLNDVLRVRDEQVERQELQAMNLDDMICLPRVELSCWLMSCQALIVLIYTLRSQRQAELVVMGEPLGL